MENEGQTISELSIDSQLIYDKLKEIKTGEIASYAHLSQLIGRNVQAEAYGNMHTAVKMCLRERVVFEAVRNVGLKRLDDHEIIGTGINTMARIRRTSKKGAMKLGSVQDFAALSREEKIKHNSLLSLLGAVKHFTSASSVKKIEGAVSEANNKLALGKTIEVFGGSKV